MKKIGLKDLVESDIGPNSPDSLYSQYTSKKSGGGGKKIQKMLGIEDHGHPPLNRNPLSMMDILKTIPMYDEMDLEKEPEQEGDFDESEDE